MIDGISFRSWKCLVFSAPTSKMDASKEIVALGMCQFVGSFIGTLPITCSFGRSVINSSSGVNTPVLSGCITGLIILATCAFLTPYFAYIPTAALSAVIICAMIFTIDVEILLPIWKSKSEFWHIWSGFIYNTLTYLCTLQKLIWYLIPWLFWSVCLSVRIWGWSLAP